MQTVYRQHVRNQLFEAEERRFAESLPRVHIEKQRRALRTEIRRVSFEMRNGEFDDVTGYAEKHAHRLRLLRALHTLQEDQPLDAAGVRCPLVRCAAAPCCGYVMDASTGQCNACARQTCVACGEVKDTGHRCRTEAIESLRAIQRDCRPCARCAAPSFRTEGCPVMWCVSCHTFWNWDTRRIIDARSHAPHNPDHRAWLASGRVNPREVDDVPCGGLPDGEQLHMALLREFATTQVVSLIAGTLIGAADAVHRAQRLRHHYPQTADHTQQNETLRVAFLIGDIDRAKFACALERQQRTSLFKRDVGETLATFVLASADVFQRLCAPDSTLACTDAYFMMDELRCFTNTALHALSREHGRRVPALDATWTWRLPGRRINA